ncbi:MAG: glycosyltransferase family 39 protein [Chloroflexi bacterium]|nr:glycosyltransferase family 39 protein [Chloroflexota bacterium]
MKRRLLVVGLILAAAALSLLTLGHKSLWLDEAFSAWQASQRITDIWITNPDTAHPPLYYTLLHGWLPVTSSEIGLRLPSAWAFLLTTAAVFVLGRKVGGYEVGWFAAAMWAVSPLAVWYAQEARMYAIAALVATFLALGLVWQSRKGWLLFALALVVGLYLDFTLVFLWAGLSGIWLGWWWQRGRERQPVSHWFVASLAGWVAFWPGRFFLPGLLEPLQSVANRLPLPLPVITLAWLPGLLLLVIGGGVIVYYLFIQPRTRPLFTGLIIPFCLLLTLLMLVPDLFYSSGCF